MSATREPHAPLKLTVDLPSEGLCVIQAAGELDAHTGDLLTASVRENVTAERPRLILDLEGVTFLGSAGISALVECSRHLNDVSADAALYLSGTERRTVYRPLELVGLLPLFSAHPTLAEALAEANASAAGAHDTNSTDSEAR
ncbi:MAG TPA: STAS domain-containing protein [Pseudonocardia sp.]|jgi:anti-anti-sigma factor|nr:STAS domain-containing protein [Pseudonocardia sp.]